MDEDLFGWIPCPSGKEEVIRSEASSANELFKRGIRRKLIERSDRESYLPKHDKDRFLVISKTNMKAIRRRRCIDQLIARRENGMIKGVAGIRRLSLYVPEKNDQESERLEVPWRRTSKRFLTRNSEVTEIFSK